MRLLGHVGCRRGSTPQRSTGQQPFLIRHSYSLLLLPLVYSLLLISRRVLTSPDRVLELDSSPVVPSVRDAGR